MGKTSIEWAQHVWNPVTGCTRVSSGCDFCYAATMTKRLAAMGQEKYAGLINEGKGHFNGVIKLHPDTLEIPLRRKKPTTYFVNSMSDLFHRDVPFEFVDKVFAVMALAHQHTFQILTKRPDRMAEYMTTGESRYFDSGRFGKVIDASFELEREGIIEPFMRDGTGSWWPIVNVWLGTSVENQETADERIPHLLRCTAAVRFLSCEPLLGPVDLTRIRWARIDVNPADYARHGVPAPDEMWSLNNALVSLEADEWNAEKPGIDWVIVGGESGPGARPMHPEWARSIRDQCVKADVAFHFKQWGAWSPEPYEGYDAIVEAAPGHRNLGLDLVMVRVGKHTAGRELDGRTWDEMPETELEAIE